MLLIPAIDLKDGKCVRLKQGDMNDSTTFGEDPAAMARRWLEAGARRLHLVDLNGAFAGKPKNEAAIKAIIKTVREYAEETDTEEIPVQLGGGIRDLGDEPPAGGRRERRGAGLAGSVASAGGAHRDRGRRCWQGAAGRRRAASGSLIGRLSPRTDGPERLGRLDQRPERAVPRWVICLPIFSAIVLS